MIRYHIFSTAFGPGAILFQSEPFLVKRILLPRSREKALRKVLGEKGAVKEDVIPPVLSLSRDLQAYFEGKPPSFQWDCLDLGPLTPLQRLVLEAVGRVPYGETRSYQQIAALVGRPKACRFVGTTLARNPFPVVIPCHRIVRADGSLGDFGGGKALKGQMLALEGWSSQ